DEPKKHAMICVLRFVQEHRRWSARIKDHYIQLSIIIDVAESGASSRMRSPGIEPRLIGHFLESEIAPVAKELNRLGKPILFRERVEQRRKVTVSNENVQPSVIVKIAKASSPFHGSFCQTGDTGFASDVYEMVALIPIEAGRLIVSAGNKQVEFAIAIKIAECACHVSVA